MSLTMNYLSVICCLASIYICNGCQMEGVNTWQFPIIVRIEDYHDGIILQRGITNIIGYSVTSYADLNGGPYVDVSIADSLFVLRTNAAYRDYEENETSQAMSLTFTFTCADGTTSLPLSVRIEINDNNNNDPLFRTEDTAASSDTTYDFTIALPVPPGFLITDCVRDIISVRIEINDNNNNDPLFRTEDTAASSDTTYDFTIALPVPPGFLITDCVRDIISVRIEINDNNNNDPLFRTEDTAASSDTTYDFTIALPVPPGFLITDCVRDIIVRDIDLTTYRIDFGIEDNPYIEIEYDESASSVAKEFKAILKTTTFIRSLPEPIVLRISATDVDLTGDDPITTYTTVTLHGSAEFELPTEPVFSEPFYLANYQEYGHVVLDRTIFLQQGYDDQVEFSLEGDYARDHFDITIDGNQVALVLTSPLPAEVLRQDQIFLVVRATRAYTSGASATIVVQMPEAVNLEFQQPHYEGQIVDNTLQLTQLILSNGYQESTVTVTVEDYPSFFTASVVGNLITLSMTPLDVNIIEGNNFISLRVTASSDHSSATTIVTLEIIKDDTVTPVFEKPLYDAMYDTTLGLTLEPLILVQGYDESVQITFSGEHESYFELIRDGASSRLRVVGALPPQVLSNTHLLLSIDATKPRTVGASAVISITLPAARDLQFEAPTYRGSMQDNTLTIETIILSVGYDEDVTFSVSGDYSSSFVVTNVQNQVWINLATQLPPEVLAQNDVLLLTITAAGHNALSTSATVLVDIIKNDVTTPVFSQPIYFGNYLASSGIDMANINLVQGYDNSVVFRIEGENSQYFQINHNTENSLTLVVQSSIPEDVIFNEKVFVFNIFADKPLTVGANAAILIKFSEEITEPTVMQFAKHTYIGSLEENILTLENIILDTGFAAGTEFHLTGDYASYFTTAITNNLITLSLPSGLSADILDNNKYIVLELEARRERAVSVFTSIVIDLVEAVAVTPLFSQAYYTGKYTGENVLQFEETMTLLQGYDETVTFALEGESSVWFALVQNGNSAGLIAISNVPQQVLDFNHQLLFTIVANKPNAISGRSAISIDLPKDIVTPEVLRFEQNSYEGQIDGSNLQIPPITLMNEFTDLTIELTGDHAEHFSVYHNLNAVYLTLLAELPPELISNNEFLVIGIKASKPDALSAYTTLILTIVKEPQIVTPIFEQTFYTGKFSEQNGLLFEHIIRLMQGFDDSVSFILDGDHAQWFTLVADGDSVTLVISSVIPPAVIANNQQLVFVVAALKPNSNTARATVVISLVDEFTDATVLGFERASYLGAIENDVSTIEPIVLNEGFTSAVTFTLHGDLASYFTLTVQGSSVNVVLQSTIPQQSVPANNIVLLELRAVVPQAVPAATAVVFEVVREEVVTPEELSFSTPYYTGQFSVAAGLVFENAISLSQGYDQNVQFALEGDHAQWFTLVADGNSVTLVSSVIPPAVIANNQQLVFVLAALKPNSNTARATVVISLVDEFTDATVLGFERASYLGAIENDVSTIEPIVLNEGFTSAVTFTLHGDLASYFTLAVQESSVNVVLQSAIPQQSAPTNNIVLLELRAVAPQAVPAVTAVVFEVVREEVVTPEELSFSTPYYTGQFSIAGGLVFENAISLSQGYDQNVLFALEGDHAQWFTLVAHGNSVTLVISSVIPPAVIANNQQLVFIVTALKPKSKTARATVVISLVDEFTDATVLGFERASYLGAIENDVSTIEPIVLNEGFTSAVTFTLHGDLASYFTLAVQGSSVNVVLQSAISQQSVPTNNIVLLELHAVAPQAVPAVTAVVFEVVREEVVTPDELSFSTPYYTGQFSVAGGLVFENAISLSQGYDQNVQFALEGDHAQWFTLVADGNSVTLVISSVIPPAVIANNQQFVFIVTALKPNSNTARATVVISLVDEFTDATVLGFERASYLGAIENDVSTIEPIVLNEGFTSAVTFTLHGDLASYFTLAVQESSVNVVLQSAIPQQSAPTNNIVLLELRAVAPQAVPAVTAVVFEVVREEVVTPEELSFSTPYYTGQFSIAGGLVFENAISLSQGYDQNVQFALEGDHAQWFTLVAHGNSVTLVISSVIPPAVIANNQQLVFIVTALKPNSNTARATVVISLVDEFTDVTVLGFERASYLGAIENDVSTIEPIVLNEGFTSAVTFTLHGDLASYFTLAVQESSVNVVLQSAIPQRSAPTNNIVLLELRAVAPQAVPAVTAVVFEVVWEEVVTPEELSFSTPYYTGQFSIAGGLVFENAISLSQGYDQNVLFALEGDHAQWFTLVAHGNSVTLVMSSVIPPAVIANNQQLVFIATALKPNSNTARATVVISLVDEFTDATVLGFERASYLGAIENDVSTIEPIVLNEGFTSAVTFTLHGDLASYFTLAVQESSVNVVLQSAIPQQSVPTNNIVLLELRAVASQAVPAVTAVVFEVVREEVVVTPEDLSFSTPYYTGQFSIAGGLVFENAISLSQGYDQNVLFALEGDHAQWFTLVADGNSVTLDISSVIPPAVIANNQQLVFIVTALKPNSNTASATVVISLIDGSGSVTDVAFDKVLYNGIISSEGVQHELISITGYDGDMVELFGDYRYLFLASASEGSVTVAAAGSVNLPQDVTYLPLELRAGGASAVLILHVTTLETPELPSVTFGAPSYVLRVDMALIGLVGRVSATASNGESVTYTLAVDNAHLQERVSVTGDGEIHLSAPANTGVYIFQVIATSIITQVEATATVHLTVDATNTCGEDNHVLPPLIILDRDEEEPHENLVVLDSATNPGCQFRLTNRWPLEHDWLYVNENGLHARSIDREDPRITFMALSQVQVELVLECPSDSQTRAKRSVNTSSRLDWLGPYDYGSNKWILTDTILYNSRRSFVNLIVNDINDNYPIFIGKENEPIIVGYPIRELEEIVFPRALVELKATDADVGENAALRYWSAEESLAVAPTTGSVHVRDGAALADGALLVAAATDRNGQDGLTGTIQLLVKLLDVRHIAVVTVRNAFLDQEEDILRNISAAVGYEVKVLSSAIISDDTHVASDSPNTRNKRDVTIAEGASLQLYVYGVIDREPVAVDQLSTDITQNVSTGVDITRTISLEDHLEGREIHSGRDTALLVSTIVLSVLLFILIVIIAVWFFPRWRKARNYEQFSDANSLASRNEPLELPPKVDSLKKPRLNLEELKRSERRLQDMLDAPIAPIKEVPAKLSTSVEDANGTFDTILNMAPPETTLPIVIQSIDRLKDDADSDDDDEFGEKIPKTRRKSVVTFNENVEKIIHVEDIPDDNSDVEVFRL